MSLSSTQKWLIGCGGCLGVFVLVLLICIVGGVMWCGSSTDKVSEALLGGKPPLGYMAFGFPFPQTKSADSPSGMLVMTNQTNRHVLMVIDMPLNAKQMSAVALIEHNDPQSQAAVKKMVTDFMAQAQASGHSQDMQAEQLIFEGSASEPVTGGKQFPVVQLKMYNQRRELYTPVLLGIVPEAGGKGVFLLDMDQQGGSADKTTDFTAAYKSMIDDVNQIVSGTGLAGRLVAANG